MTKAENCAAAKTCYQERRRKLDEEAEPERVKADLAERDRFCRYLIFGTRARCGGNREKLIAAMTTIVHANHKCG